MRVFYRDILICLSLAVLCLGIAMPAIAQKDEQFATAINPEPPVSEAPLGVQDCAGGIVHDDGTVELGSRATPL